MTRRADGHFAAALPGLLSGLERGEQDMALAAIQEVLTILREWDSEESKGDIERD